MAAAGGTRVVVVFYSLIESAKLAGVEPSACIRQATRWVIESPGTITIPTSLRE